MPEQKQRHGCLTAYLVAMIIANSAVVLFYLIGALWGSPLWLGWWLVALALASTFNVICVIALFKWKKWGFWGIVASASATLCLNLYLGLEPRSLSLLGPVGVAVLYWVLNIGKENRGWPQLD